VPKTIIIGSFLTELFKKIKMWAFFGTQCIMCTCTKTFSLSARGFAANPYSSLAPGPHWGTSDPLCSRSCLSWIVSMRAFGSVYGCGLVTMSADRRTPGGSRIQQSGSWSSRSLAYCRLPKARIHGYVTLTQFFVLICFYCV